MFAESELNMFVLSRIVLIVFVLTPTYCVDKEKITKGIQPIVQILDAIDDFKFGNKSLSNSFQILFDHGQRLFPYLKGFAQSMNLLDDTIINHNDINGEHFKNELDKIKKIVWEYGR